MRFDALIFDMDGLLVDSEPLWHAAEIDMIESAGYTYQDHVREQTIGVRVDEFARIIHHHYPQVGASPDAIIQAITERILQTTREQLKPMPGAEAIVRYAAQRQLPRAIASSSWEIVIDHFVGLMNWTEHIPLRFSAQHMKRGKPAPDIYLHAAEQLGFPPERCLALEDSPAGTEAALAAGMTCFTVPDPSHSRPEDFAATKAHTFPDLHAVLQRIKTQGLFS